MSNVDADDIHRPAVAMANGGVMYSQDYMNAALRASCEEALRKVTAALAGEGCAKINAIKEVRSATGLGLREAKELVEALQEACCQGSQRRLDEKDAWARQQEDAAFDRGKRHGRAEALEGVEEMRQAARRTIDTVGELAVMATRAVGFFEPHQEEMARLARRGLLGLAEDATEELRRVAGLS